MITLATARTESARQALANLVAAWPVGRTVRHEAGWTGTIAPDDGRHPGKPIPLTGGADAHALLPGGLPVVCVTWRVDGKPTTAWYRTGVLTLVGGTR